MVDVMIDGKSLISELLRTGLARIDRENSRDEERNAMENEAREAGRGMWGRRQGRNAVNGNDGESTLRR